uniref:Glycine N-acyltransferase-like protein n=1 Tax=Podarcis muralis TaxID=64176 RepID=A0A670IYM0_PODMU
MLILSCPSKLRFLEGLLKKSLPQTLQVYGEVMNINRGNPVGHEVIVDSWPDFKAVLTRPQRGVIAFVQRVAQWVEHEPLNVRVIVWSPRLGKEIPALQGVELDDPRGPFQLCDPLILWEVLGGMSVGNAVCSLTAIPYFIYLNLPPHCSSFCSPRLDPGFTFSSLNSSHIDLLNETWHYGGSEHSRKYLANMVRCFPSTCILDSNGHPISWIIMESWGASAHSYTLPSHRQRGYSSMVQRAHGMRVHAAGFPVYGHVALDNTPQHKLMDSLGFQRLSELCHYCIHSPRACT